jgi:hypothetical protein
MSTPTDGGRQAGACAGEMGHRNDRMARDVGREERRSGQHLEADLAAKEEQGAAAQPAIA